jgi:thioredoxin reductase (NADPH)
MPLVTPNQQKATREQYLAYLRTVVRTFKLSINTYEPVVDIAGPGDGQDHPFTVTTHGNGGKRQWRARKIILAVGDTDVPAMLKIPGEDLPHVSHYLREPHTYFGKRVLIIGGKNSAVEAALRLWHTGCDVTMSYRGQEFLDSHVKYWLKPELMGRIKRGEIACHFRTLPTAITSSQATLLHLDDDRTFDVDADFVLAMTGYRADSSLFRRAGVKLAGENNVPVYDDQTMQTSVPGIYIAGTAVAGTQQTYSVFLENCHIHVDRILAHLQGDPAPKAASHPYALPES